MNDPSIQSDHDATIESLTWAHHLGASQIRQVDLLGKEALISSSEIKIKDLEEFANAPYRLKAAEQFIDAGSFATYVNRFATNDTLLFGSVSKKTVTAQIDYHGVGAPSWRTHTATLQSIATPEWNAFTSASGKWFKQLEFAEFLEQWNHVVISPDAAELSEVALNLEGSVDGRFAAKINRFNGSVTFNFQEETTTGQVRVPTQIVIAVCPFHHSPLQDVRVLLRFRINDGHPIFQIVIPNAPLIEEESLKQLFASVEGSTGKPVLVGP